MTIRLKDKSGFTRHYRKIDYDEFAAALKANEYVFLENNKDEPLKRQTMWKAAKKLSVMIDKKIVAVCGDINQNGAGPVKGYLFMVEGNNEKKA